MEIFARIDTGWGTVFRPDDIACGDLDALVRDTWEKINEEAVLALADSGIAGKPERDLTTEIVVTAPQIVPRMAVARVVGVIV